MNIETYATFFMWCTIINGALYVVSAAMCILFPNRLYRVHSKWFEIPRTTFNTAIFSYLAVYKIFLIGFNLVPFLSLRIMLV